MKLPFLDMDRSWAYEDWSKYGKVVSVYNKVNKTIGDNKKKVLNAGVKTAKAVAKSPLLRKFTVDKFFSELKVEKLGSNTYRIAKQYVFQSYLLVGRNKALLIDTGLGIGNLTETIREITDKPLIVVCTHGHYGCIGGAGEFDEVMLGKADVKMAKRMYKTLHSILAKYLKDHTYSEPNFVQIDKKYLKDYIDLGGRKVRIKEFPSHTKGTLCFYDDKYAFAGDPMGPLCFNLLPGAVSINQYASNFGEISRNLASRKFYCSYWPREIKKERMIILENQLYVAAMNDNDYKDFIKIRHSDDWKQFLVYWGFKANKRNLEHRWHAIIR